MRIVFFILCISMLLLGCGKKSDPKYQGKNNKSSQIILL